MTASEKYPFLKSRDTHICPDHGQQLGILTRGQVHGTPDVLHWVCPTCRIGMAIPDLASGRLFIHTHRNERVPITFTVPKYIEDLAYSMHAQSRVLIAPTEIWSMPILRGLYASEHYVPYPQDPEFPTVTVTTELASFIIEQLRTAATYWNKSIDDTIASMVHGACT